MKSPSNFQFFPIVNDQVFEAFVCDIFNDMEKTNTYDLFDVKGQISSASIFIPMSKLQ
jgi:hypothetical protein